ncbi:beta strand repeat-containing protein [Phormidesmis sp. 146-33]
MNTCPPSRFRHLLAATLAIGSTFQFVFPTLAQSTAAGTAIRNTATGTFSDGTTTYNTTSNEVTIEVSEIAGITLTAQTPSVPNPNAGDTLFVDFVVTNTGNDPTQFSIPGTATLSNTTAFAQNGQIQIIAVNGTPLGTPVNVPNAGDSTANLLANPTIPANPGTGTTGTVTIRVPIQVLASATAGSLLTVSLGNTTPVNGQNTDRTGNISAADIFTVDNANGVGGETNATPPTNGTREAMATSGTITVAARLQAFAAVLKAIGGYSNNSTPNNLTDDTLTYRLSLKIDNPTPLPTGLVASDLYGTLLNVNNSTATPYVLVSDAIPTGLQLGTTASITTPPSWTPVYTQDPLTTSALSARWSTTRPTAGAAITRIGFIYDTTTTPLSKGTTGVGNTISGFTFTMTPIAGFTGGQVANIAQVFGQSQPGTIAPGTATQIVYDESGDQTTNNGLVGNNPDSTSGGAGANDGGITDGVANPTADGTDPGAGSDPSNTGNTNQGPDTGTNAGTKLLGGEDTVFTIAATPLNGPSGQPAAIGPTDTNDDFTNKSIVIPPNTPPNQSIDADPFTFNNTVQNTSGSSQAISLLPTPPATTTALPDNTKVTITDLATGTSATYNYTSAGGFIFESGTGGTSATIPVRITVLGGGTASYQMIVDLPAAPQLTGFPVPITAFVDTNNDGSPVNDPSNITIDRLYTNYVSLVKEARILESNGAAVSGAAGSFTTVQSDLSAAATPGRIIEYRITYRNISTSGGTNNVTLPANNLVIVESGVPTANNTSNWFGITIDPAFPTTGGVGSAADVNGTIAVTTSGTPADIQEYRDTVLSVPPGAAAGTFIFQRKIK